MKIINLVVGSVFIFLGGERIASGNPALLGWVLLVIGIAVVLFAFNGGGSSGGGGGSSWWEGDGGFGGDSGGDGGGGGGD